MLEVRLSSSMSPSLGLSGRSSLLITPGDSSPDTWYSCTYKMDDYCTLCNLVRMLMRRLNLNDGKHESIIINVNHISDNAGDARSVQKTVSKFSYEASNLLKHLASTKYFKGKLKTNISYLKKLCSPKRCHIRHQQNISSIILTVYKKISNYKKLYLLFQVFRSVWALTNCRYFPSGPNTVWPLDGWKISSQVYYSSILPCIK